MTKQNKDKIELRKILDFIEKMVLTNLEIGMDYPVGYYCMMKSGNKDYSFSVDLKPIKEESDDKRK